MGCYKEAATAAQTGERAMGNGMVSFVLGTLIIPLCYALLSFQDGNGSFGAYLAARTSSCALSQSVSLEPGK